MRALDKEGDTNKSDMGNGDNSNIGDIRSDGICLLLP